MDRKSLGGIGMSLQLEFLGFIQTPSEKHAGIATVRVNKSIVLRFKLAQKKDGSGYFPACAAYKIPDASGDRYIDAFMLDSRSDDEEIKSLVIREFKVWQKKQAPSVFDKGLSDDDNVPF